MLILAASLVTAPAGAADEDRARLYLTIDKTQVISFHPTIHRIAVTNPAIADVHVVSPTQLLLSGKATGRTSLVVFHPDRLRHFDVIVHPAPAGTPRAALVPDQEHTVEVLRAGQASQQLFVRDTERAWVRLGAPTAAPEAPKK